MSELLSYRKPGSPSLDNDDLYVLRQLLRFDRPIADFPAHRRTIGRLRHRGLVELCADSFTVSRIKTSIRMTPLGRELLAKFED